MRLLNRSIFAVGICLILGGCKLFEPLPTLPPVLTLPPPAVDEVAAPVLTAQPLAPQQTLIATSQLAAESTASAGYPTAPSPGNTLQAGVTAALPTSPQPGVPTQPAPPRPGSSPVGPPAPTSTQAPAQLETWHGVPIMPGASGGVEELGSYTYAINAAVTQVRQFYDREMINLGWQVFTAGEGETGNLLLLYQKGNQTATIAILAQGGGSQVRIIVN